MKKKVPSWATKNGIAVGRRYAVKNGIKICERNRVTNFAYFRKQIRELVDYQRANYTSKGVNSVLLGINITGNTQTAYAVYCEVGKTDG